MIDGLVNLLGVVLLTGFFCIAIMLVGAIMFIMVGVVVILINYFTGALENIADKFADILDLL